MTSRTWMLASLLLGLATQLPAFAADIPVGRGETASFAIDVINRSAADSEAIFRSDLLESSLVGYTVTAEENSCWISTGAPGGDGLSPVELRVGPVPANATVRCTLQVRRAQVSRGLAWVRFEADTAHPEVELADNEWLFGSLTNVSLRSEQVAPFPSVGETTGLIRVTVTNHGGWEIERVDFGACQDFAPAPFQLDNALPNGCDDAASGPTCLPVGPGSIQFGVRALAPGESRSCMLRASAYESLSQPLRFGMSLVEEWGLWFGDEQLFDPDSSDDSFVLELAPRLPTAAAPVAVDAAPKFVLAALATLLVLLAHNYLRCRPARWQRKRRR